MECLIIILTVFLGPLATIPVLKTTTDIDYK